MRRKRKVEVFYTVYELAYRETDDGDGDIDSHDRLISCALHDYNHNYVQNSFSSMADAVEALRISCEVWEESQYNQYVILPVYRMLYDD